jgi:hypothetical protein
MILQDLRNAEPFGVDERKVWTLEKRAIAKYLDVEEADLYCVRSFQWKICCLRCWRSKESKFWRGLEVDRLCKTGNSSWFCGSLHWPQHMCWDCHGHTDLYWDCRDVWLDQITPKSVILLTGLPSCPDCFGSVCGWSIHTWKFWVLVCHEKWTRNESLAYDSSQKWQGLVKFLIVG